MRFPCRATALSPFYILLGALPATQLSWIGFQKISEVKELRVDISAKSIELAAGHGVVQVVTSAVYCASFLHRICAEI